MVFSAVEWCQWRHKSKSPSPSSLNHFRMGFLPAKVLTSSVVCPSTSSFSSTSNLKTSSKSSHSILKVSNHNGEMPRFSVETEEAQLQM